MENLKIKNLKAIPSTNGKYLADNLGNIYTVIKKVKLMNPETMKNGYLSIKAFVDYKYKTSGVHRLVCEAFHGAPPTKKHQCCHKDGNKKNNTPENLYWGTAKENASDKKLHGTYLVGNKHPSTKTHCSRGHDLSIYGRIRRNSISSRSCRLCHRVYGKKYRDKKNKEFNDETK